MYGATRTALKILEANPQWTRTKKAVLSHRVRLNQSEEKPPRIDSYLMEKVVDGSIKLPTPGAQALNALRYVAERVQESGEPLEELPIDFSAAIGAPHHDASALIIDGLIDLGLIKGQDASTSDERNFFDIHPTLLGWDRYENEQQGKQSTRVAIIAMKFGDELLDGFVDTIVKAAVTEAGYDLERVSDRPRAGVIDQIMRIKIRDAPFLIADLTHSNNGAYWEAGFAEGLGKPVIYLCHEDKWTTTRTHFDTNHCETISWHQDRAPEFRERLVAIIRNSMAGRN